MPQRIGIIGGSFDPIHLGHLIIAVDALEQCQLDRVLFVPAFQAPLKSKASEASPEQRMEMTRRAIAGEPRFALSDVDFLPGGTSYSVQTARRLARRHAEAEFFWVLGADQIAQLHQWRDIDELARLVGFVAFDRPGFPSEPDPALPAHTQILRATGRQLDISSTEIRERLKSGRSAKYFLPASVFDYIKTARLYRETHPTNDR